MQPKALRKPIIPFLIILYEHCQRKIITIIISYCLVFAKNQFCLFWCVSLRSSKLYARRETANAFNSERRKLCQDASVTRLLPNGLQAFPMMKSLLAFVQRDSLKWLPKKTFTFFTYNFSTQKNIPLTTCRQRLCNIYLRSFKAYGIEIGTEFTTDFTMFV